MISFADFIVCVLAGVVYREIIEVSLEMIREFHKWRNV